MIPDKRLCLWCGEELDFGSMRYDLKRYCKKSHTNLGHKFGFTKLFPSITYCRWCSKILEGRLYCDCNCKAKYLRKTSPTIKAYEFSYRRTKNNKLKHRVLSREYRKINKEKVKESLTKWRLKAKECLSDAYMRGVINHSSNKTKYVLTPEIIQQFRELYILRKLYKKAKKELKNEKKTI